MSDYIIALVTRLINFRRDSEADNDPAREAERRRQADPEAAVRPQPERGGRQGGQHDARRLLAQGQRHGARSIHPQPAAAPQRHGGHRVGQEARAEGQAGV